MNSLASSSSFTGLERHRDALLDEIRELTAERDGLLRERNNGRERNDRDAADLLREYREESSRMSRQVDDLLDERSALLKKVEAMEARWSSLSSLSSSSSKVRGRDASTQTTATTTERRPPLPPPSPSRGGSGTAFVATRRPSDVSDVSTLASADSEETVGTANTYATSESRSVRIHAAKVLHMANSSSGSVSGSNSVSGSSVASAVRKKLARARRRGGRSAGRGSVAPTNDAVPDGDAKKKSSSSRKKKDGDVFAGTPEDQEFFLPRVSNEKTTTTTTTITDPVALSNVLRPWQVDFLRSVRVATASQLVFAGRSKSAAKDMIKSMGRYREQNGLKYYKPKSCAVALHIWVRTVEAKIKGCLDDRNNNGGLVVDKGNI